MGQPCTDRGGPGGCRIQTWALEEARRRLEAEGIIEDSTKPKKSTLRTVSGHLPPKH